MTNDEEPALHYTERYSYDTGCLACMAARADAAEVAGELADGRNRPDFRADPSSAEALPPHWMQRSS